jgi:hypothetical protein
MSCGVSSNFVGLIDEARVYAKALTASEVGKIYAEGARAHEFAYRVE